MIALQQVLELPSDGTHNYNLVKEQYYWLKHGNLLAIEMATQHESYMGFSENKCK